MIEIANLTKKYGKFTAVDNISFQVKKGDILGFLGPNGAGKSTTMKIICGFISPTSGSVAINGDSILEKPLQAKRCIGYLPESSPSYKEMTVIEFLQFISSVRGMAKHIKNSRIDEIIGITALNEVAYKPIHTLSKGYKQRVGIAQSILHDPPILVLDEPTDGLDPNQKYEVRNLIQQLSADKSIILSTHILEEMQAVCNRAIIINTGKIVTDTTPQELKKISSKYNSISITVGELSLEQLNKIEEIEGVDTVSLEENTLYVTPQKEMQVLGELTRFFNENSITFTAINMNKEYYDEIFRTLTTQ